MEYTDAQKMFEELVYPSAYHALPLDAATKAAHKTLLAESPLAGFLAIHHACGPVAPEAVERFEQVAAVCVDLEKCKHATNIIGVLKNAGVQTELKALGLRADTIRDHAVAIGAGKLTDTPLSPLSEAIEPLRSQMRRPSPLAAAAAASATQQAHHTPPVAETLEELANSAKTKLGHGGEAAIENEAKWFKTTKGMVGIAAAIVVTIGCIALFSRKKQATPEQEQQPAAAR